MKKIIYSLLSILLCGLQSCVDLDMAPYNQVASGNMWSNAALTNQGVAGVYAKCVDGVFIPLLIVIMWFLLNAWA